MSIADDRYILNQAAIGRWHINDGWLRIREYNHISPNTNWDSLSWGEGREPYTDLTSQLLYVMGQKRTSRKLLTKGIWKC